MADSLAAAATAFVVAHAATVTATAGSRVIGLVLLPHLAPPHLALHLQLLSNV
jgi:hypothetical protein